MKAGRCRGLLIVALLGLGDVGASELFFDRIEEALTFSSADGSWRARVSGTWELELYDLPRPAPGVIDADRRHLVNPRATFFLDAQLGPRVYGFAQARIDRGFDPGDRPGEVRLDEYALRVRPWTARSLTFQVGRFATVVGNWAARHASWTNPFLQAPLPYDHLTGMWDTDAVRTSQTLLQWSHLRPGLPANVRAVEKTLRIPIVWGPGYTPGVSVAGGIGRFTLAAELKYGSLSSRPEAWAELREQRHHPTGNVRVGYAPSPTWSFGMSASSGAYLREFADRTLPAGRHRGDYRQQVVALDGAYAWRHWQVWAEAFGCRFEVPGVGPADTWAYYVEARYKFTPGFSAAWRWAQQGFGTIADRGGRVAWGKDVWQIDVAPAFRFSAHTQLKLQYSLKHGDTGSDARTARMLGAQWLVRF